MPEPNPIAVKALELAIDKLQGRRAVAQLCGVTEQAVINWLRRDATVPFGACIAIVDECDDKRITLAKLRPDFVESIKAFRRLAVDRADLLGVRAR